ncbi:MAG: LPS export ABC transporter periplasmic protein LptC [Prevotellaceae bacterium]|nr:LPS export ABC transporter periplasmic protein LptC [Prevotellaceae bacterium]
MKTISPYRAKLLAALLLPAAALSCKNSIEKIREINDIQSIPSLRMENLNGRTTEMGNVKVRFISPELRQFHFAEEKYTDFPKGIELYRYLDSTTVESSITADHAISHEAKQLWEATGNVVVKNMNGDELRTEKLFWDEKTKKIYTDAMVKIIDTEKGAIIYGKGLVANESFTDYEIQDVFDSVLYFDDEKK